MDGLISFIGIGSIIYYLGNKFTRERKASENDPIAGGASWLIAIVMGGFLFGILASYLGNFCTFETPFQIILHVMLGVIFIYYSYRITCKFFSERNELRHAKGNE